MNEPRLSFDLGFAPDADTMRPGVVTDCLNMVPGASGMETMLRPYQRSTLFTTGDDFRVIGYSYAPKDFSEWAANEFAGTPTKLNTKQWFTGTWFDSSRTLSYTASAAQVWSFEHFGNYVIAAAKPAGPLLGTIPLQACDVSGSTATGFTDIAGAPTCAVITSAERFVLAFNGQAGSNDSWACCARDNHLSWTASPSTLANSGRLVDPPGHINAAAALGNDVIVYKSRGMIRGTFVEGDAEVWKWSRLPFKVGAVGPRAVANTHDGRHVFMASDSCYLFDGSNLIDLLDSRAKRWFVRARNDGSWGAHSAHYNPRTGCAWFCFPPNGTLEGVVPIVAQSVLGLVVHLPTGRIGKVQLAADVVALMPGAGSGLPDIGWFDSVGRDQWILDPYESVESGAMLDNTVVGMTDMLPPYVATGDFGDRWDYTQIDGVRVDAVRVGDTTNPFSATLFTRDGRAVREPMTYDSTVTGILAAGSSERFAARANGRWHRARIDFSGPAEVTGVTLDAPKYGGRRT